MTTKARTYGRRKGQDLAAFFNNLSLDSPIKNTCQACNGSQEDSANNKVNEDVQIEAVDVNKERSALIPRSANASKRQSNVDANVEEKSCTEKPRTAKPRTLTKRKLESEC